MCVGAEFAHACRHLDDELGGFSQCYQTHFGETSSVTFNERKVGISPAMPFRGKKNDSECEAE
jgi:hypothetical protein